MAPAVSVLVPWRPDGTERDQAWEYVSRWWAQHHPNWQVVTGMCPDGPWRKALAVGDALARADGDVLVVADADVVCLEIAGAVYQVATGRAPWAIPHGIVYRLTAGASQRVYDGAPLPPRPVEVARTPYLGTEGGGLVALPRATYEQVPLDPRFVIWGQDDEAWALALRTLAGPPWRGTAPLWHLWHPPAPRHNQRVGNKPGWALYSRYQRAARQGRVAMEQLIAEFTDTAWEGGTVDVLGPGWDDLPVHREPPTVRFECLKYPNLDLSSKPGLSGVRFVDGYCEVSRRPAIAILQSAWWQRRGIRLVA